MALLALLRFSERRVCDNILFSPSCYKKDFIPIDLALLLTGLFLVTAIMSGSIFCVLSGDSYSALSFTSWPKCGDSGALILNSSLSSFSMVSLM